MLKGELARAKKMAELADNKHQVLLRLKTITEQYGVLLTELLGDQSDDDSDTSNDNDVDHAEGNVSESDGRV
jgi:hypothetical protein